MKNESMLSGAKKQFQNSERNLRESNALADLEKSHLKQNCLRQKINTVKTRRESQMRADLSSMATSPIKTKPSSYRGSFVTANTGGSCGLKSNELST